MKNIIALIDFTHVSDNVIKQASILGKQHGYPIVLCHFTEKESDQSEFQMKLDEMAAKISKGGISCDTLVVIGNIFFSRISEAILKAGGSLVIIGTHGREGIMQNLFGSNVWKLINAIPCSALVVNEHSKINENGFEKVLMPLGPHSEFAHKADLTSSLLAPTGIIDLFAIEKPGVPIGEKMLTLARTSQDYFDEKKVKHSYVEIESSHYSIGYSRDTVDYAKNNRVDVISILTRISEDNAHFGSLDKENMVLNEDGIPILCVK